MRFADYLRRGQPLPIDTTGGADLPTVETVEQAERLGLHYMVPQLRLREELAALKSSPSNAEPLTLAAAAKVTGLSRKTLYRLAPDDSTPFYKLRSRWLVDPDKLAAWVDRETAAAAPTPPPSRPSKARRGARKVL